MTRNNGLPVASEK